MTELHIGDVHLKLNLLKRILKNHENDYERVVFHGDLFDHFVEGFDGRCTSKQMATWVKENIDNPKYIFLLGNHDIPYGLPGYYNHQMCGFTYEKSRMINSVMTPEDWAKWKMFHWVELDDELWISSHAGFNRSHFPINPIQKMERFNTTPLAVHQRDPWLYPGHDRGFSWQTLGGPLWCDWFMISDIDGVRQIVGHTPGEFPRVTRNNYNIDTELNFVGSFDDSVDKSVAFYTFRP